MRQQLAPVVAWFVLAARYLGAFTVLPKCFKSASKVHPPQALGQLSTVPLGPIRALTRIAAAVATVFLLRVTTLVVTRPEPGHEACKHQGSNSCARS